MDYLKKNLSNHTKEPTNSTHMTPQGIRAGTHCWEVEGSDYYTNLAPCRVFFSFFSYRIVFSDKLESLFEA